MKYKSFIVAFAFALVFTGCRTEKSPLGMFIDIDEIKDPIPVENYELLIEPSDELFITINSSMPEASAPYNMPAVNPATKDSFGGSTNPRQQCYVVNPEGYINLPVIGDIKAQGLTREQLRKKIEEIVSQDIEDPHVFIDFVGFKVHVMGEVQRPGSHLVSTERYSVLDALADSGDLTQYGERNNVLLIREENGERKHIRLNLNSADVLMSPYFFLKQNDVIYVQPNKVRQDNSEYNQFHSYRLSVISTITGISASIISLIIAFSR